MFLLILEKQLPKKVNYEFTFQYVSINTIINCTESAVCKHLHSNMFLLIQIPLPHIPPESPNLHSNMFLLIQWEQEKKYTKIMNLHSNMFLLIRYHPDFSGNPFSTFTFQYVSINTELPEGHVYKFIYLHSNMFLLIQWEQEKKYTKIMNLHSNMFLLIRK